MTSVGDEIKEWQRLLDLTNVKSVKDKINKHITDLKCISPCTINSTINGTNGDVKSSKQCKTINEFSWEQETSSIKIRIKFDNISTHDRSKINLQCDASSVSLTVNDFKSPDNNANYMFRIAKLHSKINPEKSSYHLKTNYIVLSLEKESPGHWPSVEYKQSNITKPKIPEADKDSDPNSMLIDLMKNLYQEGDDEMKRTIAKAWTEANEKRNFV
ncbi:Calcyclin-binding protein [Babesia microti strain RI]|uniref:Calcyclin-binding protein n=1 Tax=Babesia microti (strain RI) TaxID=1133968 RepID=I7JCP1_BABMR|nr:Calcyclin-binding protein [Babesia microti strain RI]CCF75340.1 Calcyclin-binding protein [Babesia microti strain RI]|eukprot:XP_012649748.1 Calcyclin-binding protein [Babesia microti strain RI]